jgi:hypothetical protein
MDEMMNGNYENAVGQTGWVNYKLETIAKLISGRTPDREQKEYYAPQGLPWVKIENLDRGVITETTEYLSQAGREKVNLLPENSVLFSIVGTIGKVGITGVSSATNQQIVALIFDETKVLPLYGYYCLRYHADEIKKLSDQTTMPIISRKTLGQYRIAVPKSLELQQQIVVQLQKFEDYAVKKEDMKRQFGRYETVLFQKMFGREDEYHEKLALKEFLRAPIISGTPKNEAPKDEQWRIREGDILLRNGVLTLAEKQEETKYFDRNVLCIRVRDTQLLPEVLYAYLGLDRMKHILYGERKTGDSRKRPIRPAELERMNIAYFTMEKQLAYAKCLKKIHHIQRLLDQEIAGGWKAFDMVMALFFSGYARGEAPETAARNDRGEAPAQAMPPEAAARNARGEAPAQAMPPETAALNAPRNDQTVSRIVLGVLACWCPRDGRTEAYAKRRQNIFRRAQPFFQPAAISFVAGGGQREYLLEKDFLAYHAPVLCRQWEEPMELLKSLLRQYESGELQDAHLAFQGEAGICTEAVWSDAVTEDMAREGLVLLAAYSGFGACEYLFR